ncbi:MAG: hypothetical protein KFF73_02440 [Cyclobacteriaceae bacterium]|nr:hypothetical protein [Cyclobacteriaceae bacterium]
MSIFFGYRSSAQSLSPEIILAYQKILEGKLDSSHLILNHKFTNDQDRAFKIYIRSLEDLLVLSLNRNKPLYQNYAEREKEYNAALGSLRKEDEFISFIKSEIRLHSAIIRFRYNDQFSGALRLIQSYNMVKSMLKEPEPPPYIYKTAGVLNILLSIVPEKYDLVLRLIGIRPDLATGIQQLEKLTEINGLFLFEGHMVWALLNAYYLNEPEKSYAVISMNEKIRQKSLLYNYLAGLIYMKGRDNDKTIQSFKKCLQFNAEYMKIPSATFYLAESYMKKLDFSRAGTYYHQYLNQSGARDLKKASYYGLYLISLFNNDSISGENYRKKVVHEGQLSAEADEYVYSLVVNNHYPHPEIQKSRLLFDGGYYEESLRMLQSIGQANLDEEEKLEYQYRKGRVNQLLNDYQAAEKYFELMFRSSFDDHYLVANAHLQMGYIEYEKGFPDESAVHFREAMKYSGAYYKTSIRNEAEAGLSLVD